MDGFVYMTCTLYSSSLPICARESCHFFASFIEDKVLLIKLVKVQMAAAACCGGRWMSQIRHRDSAWPHLWGYVSHRQTVVTATAGLSDRGKASRTLARLRSLEPSLTFHSIPFLFLVFFPLYRVTVRRVCRCISACEIKK